VLEAVSRFKQGDVVEAPPFFYCAAPRYGLWELSGLADDPAAPQEVLELAPEDGPPYGLITTQTCDLYEQSPRPKQPWIKIAPVYDMGGALDKGQRKQVANHEIGHLVMLTGNNLPSGLWIADLRIEVPVEKGWLVGREPITAFETEDDYLRLARRLARRADRPALDNAVSICVVRSLREQLGKLGKAERASLTGEIRELRLAITGPRLTPSAARLIIIAHDTPSERVKEWFDEWWEAAREGCHAIGVTLLGNRYATMASLTAADYDTAVALDFDYLSPDD
jgi:hypothetical protein